MYGKNYNDSEEYSGHNATGLERATSREIAIAEKFSRQMGIELLNRNRPAALSLVDRALNELDPPVKPEFYKVPLAQIIDVRLANSLERCLNCVTVEDVLAQDDRALAAVPNWGINSVLSLHKALSRLAIKWATDLSRAA